MKPHSLVGKLPNYTAALAALVLLCSCQTPLLKEAGGLMVANNEKYAAENRVAEIPESGPVATEGRKRYKAAQDNVNRWLAAVKLRLELELPRGGSVHVTSNEFYEANGPAIKQFNAVTGSKGALSDFIIDLIVRGADEIARRKARKREAEFKNETNILQKLAWEDWEVIRQKRR